MVTDLKRPKRLRAIAARIATPRSSAQWETL
jgi:hypothetical protein